MSRLMFTDMQQEFHRMCMEQEEAVQAATKYRNDLFNCRDELKEANEMVRLRNDSILVMENEMEHAQVERDKARAELEKAREALCKNERALANVVWERNILKVYVVGALVAQAREEAIHEYKVNFKDTDDYLDLIRDATMEYKESLKRVDPSFDADHYDRLILCEPQTPTSEDLVGFDQLDPIGTPGTAAGPSADRDIASAEEPTEALANQDAAQVISQPAVLAADQPTDPLAA